MSRNEIEPRQPRWLAGLVIGGLAAGAVAGAVASAEPGAHAHWSVQDQFQAAFTPGALNPPDCSTAIIIPDK